MATRAHSTRTPLLPPPGATPPLLRRGLGRQPGPVTLAIAAMHAADPERLHIRELRRRISERIEADIALLDALDGDPDLEADHVTTERDPDGSLFLMARSSDDEPSLCGVGTHPGGCLNLWQGYPQMGGAYGDSAEDIEADDADGPEGDDEREHESTDDNGIGDYAGLWDQTGEGAASARGFAVYA